MSRGGGEKRKAADEEGEREACKGRPEEELVRDIRRISVMDPSLRFGSQRPSVALAYPAVVLARSMSSSPRPQRLSYTYTHFAEHVCSDLYCRPSALAMIPSI